MNITTLEALRAFYDAAHERSVKKEMLQLDAHCARFIALSPFVTIASAGAGVGTNVGADIGVNGSTGQALDASPRGGAPGFVKVQGANTLLIPDSPGNNRLDTLENIVQTGRVGLLFLVPGIDETLRVNGRAALTTDAATLAFCADAKRLPKLVIRVSVEAAYLHCAKALMRSNLWDARRHVDRAALPSMGEMLKDQIGGGIPAETQAQMLARYALDL